MSKVKEQRSKVLMSVSYTQKAKIKKYYRKNDITKPQPSQKLPHTVAKITAHRRENNRTPPI